MCTLMLEFLQMGRVTAAFLQHLTATASKMLHQQAHHSIKRTMYSVTKMAKSVTIVPLAS